MPVLNADGDEQRFQRGPAWRWRLAADLVSERVHMPTGAGDPQVRAVVAYLRERRSGRLAKELPPVAAHLEAAEELAENAPLCAQLKILVMADCTPEDTALRLSVPVPVVATWESVFFDIRPVRSALDWILEHVIKPEEEGTNAHLAARLKLAFVGGSTAATAVIDAESYVSTCRGVRLFDARLRLYLAFRELEVYSIATLARRRKFLSKLDDAREREQRLRRATEQFEEHCHEALRQQKLAEHRRQRQHERHHRRAIDQRESRWLRDLRRQADSQTQQLRQQAARDRVARPMLAQLRWQCRETKVLEAPTPNGAPNPAGADAARQTSDLTPPRRSRTFDAAGQMSTEP